MAIGLETALVRNLLRGAIDEDVVAFAEQNAWALITEDRRFGQLGLAVGAPSMGLVVMAMGDASPAGKAARLAQTLPAFLADLQGHLVVITPERVRRRRLSPGAVGA